MSTKKKKRSIFKRRSYFKIWIDANGECHSKVRGSMQQNQTNFNTMVTYFKAQAQAMGASYTLVLAATPPNVIIGTMGVDQRVTPSAEYKGYNGK